MTEYLVQHWNIRHSLWMNEKSRFNLYDALMDCESLENEFPHEKFRILKCEPIQRKP